jgi:hypothetical protein
MNGPPVPGFLKHAIASLAACVITFLAAPGAAAAGTDSTNQTHAKPSTFAPHPTSKRAFGAPIQSPIVHKRHRQAKPPSKVARTPNGHGEASK